jgi:hypothetical protein
MTSFARLRRVVAIASKPVIQDQSLFEMQRFCRDSNPA